MTRQTRTQSDIRTYLEYLRVVEAGLLTDELTLRQRNYLLAFTGYPEADLTQKRLGVIFGDVPTSVCDSVQELTTRGYLEITKGNQRGKVPKLTQKGREYCDRLSLLIKSNKKLNPIGN